jgi:hypothetical protein
VEFATARFVHIQHMGFKLSDTGDELLTCKYSLWPSECASIGIWTQSTSSAGSSHEMMRRNNYGLLHTNMFNVRHIVININ